MCPFTMIFSDQLWVSIADLHVGFGMQTERQQLTGAPDPPDSKIHRLAALCTTAPPDRAECSDWSIATGQGRPSDWSVGRRSHSFGRCVGCACCSMPRSAAAPFLLRPLLRLLLPASSNTGTCIVFCGSPATSILAWRLTWLTDDLV